MTTQPTVEPGQIWADNDKRGYGRKIRIVSIDDTHATVELVTGRGVGHDAAKPGRQTKILLRRFKPTSTGYRLVRNADGTEAEGAQR